RDRAMRTLSRVAPNQPRISSGRPRRRTRLRDHDVRAHRLRAHGLVSSLAAMLLLSLGSSCSHGDAATATLPPNPAASESPREDPRVLVRLGTFERGEISSRLTVSADLEAVREADVYPEISGVIQRV